MAVLYRSLFLLFPSSTSLHDHTFYFFIHLLMDICVISGFPLLRIKPLVNPHVLVSVFSSSHKQLGAELLECWVRGWLTSTNYPSGFPVWLYHFPSSWNTGAFWPLHTSTDIYCLASVSTILIMQMSVREYLAAFSTCIFLTSYDAEHHFTLFLVTCVTLGSAWILFYPSFNEVTFHLYILDRNPLSNITANTSYYSQECIFILLRVSFKERSIH